MRLELIVEVDQLEPDASAEDIRRAVESILQRELRYLDVAVDVIGAED